MSATPSPSQTVAVDDAPETSAAEIDASCRWPVLLLFFLLAVRKTAAHKAAVYAFLTAVLLAGFLNEAAPLQRG